MKIVTKYKYILIVTLIVVITGFFSWKYFFTDDKTIQPLLADENTSVLVLKECDLAIKFKKQAFGEITKRAPVKDSFYEEILTFSPTQSNDQTDFMCSKIQNDQGKIYNSFSYLNYLLSNNSDVEKYTSSTTETPNPVANFLNFPNYMILQTPYYDTISKYESVKEYSFIKQSLFNQDIRKNDVLLAAEQRGI